MGLPLKDLERGTGEWENIQDVLREAFLGQEQQLANHHTRLATCETLSHEVDIKVNNLTENFSKCESLPTHVDALTRVVNALSEELKQRTQAEQERHHQQAKWIESVSRAVEAQLQALQTRVASDVESVCAKMLGKMERRMELMEEELSHIVHALERKADVDLVKTHKRELDDALKQRCRKAAFDNEVVRVHQLLKAQHSTVNERLETIQNSLKSQIEVQDQAQRESVLARVADMASQQKQQEQRLRDEILATTGQSIRSAVEKAAHMVDETVTTASSKLRLEADEKAQARVGEFTKRIEEIDVRQQLSQLKIELLDSRQRMDNETTASALKIVSLEDFVRTSTRETSEQLSEVKNDAVAVQQQIDQRVSVLSDNVLTLETKLEAALEGIKPLQETVSSFQSDIVQQHRELKDEVQEATRARDKKTRQQMHLVADKLSEMDQIMKLVGKQLVQNTSQLQLLWIDQDISSGAVLHDDGELKLLADAELDPIELQQSEEHLKPTTEHGDVEEQESAERHQQLQASIEAKLREYENILTPKDAADSQ